ncbi:hypothetical protein SNEBB_007464 [Seison nebaliae]|nr:hypothetical protein SNEBB_007464 [Seison nebaliae]
MTDNNNSYSSFNTNYSKEQERIDVLSNHRLLGHGEEGKSYHTRHHQHTSVLSNNQNNNICHSIDIEGRKTMSLLHDQLKQLKKDLEKKDELIQVLSTKDKDCCHCSVGNMVDYNNNQQTLSKTTNYSYETSTETKQLKMKSEKLSSINHDLRVRLETLKDNEVEMKEKVQMLQSENESLFRSHDACQKELQELKRKLCSAESIGNKSSITIDTLLKDDRQIKERLFEVEARNETLIKEKEDLEQMRTTLENRFTELLTEVDTIGIHGLSFGNKPEMMESIDRLISRIREIYRENNEAKGELYSLRTSLKSLEKEGGHTRDTVQNLALELNHLEREKSTYSFNYNQMKAEIEDSRVQCDRLKEDNAQLTKQLDTLRVAWKDTKTELEAVDSRYHSVENEMRQLRLSNDVNEGQLKMFHKEISSILKTKSICLNESCTIGDIKETIRLLITTLQQKELELEENQKNLLEMATKLNNSVKDYNDLQEKCNNMSFVACDNEKLYKRREDEIHSQAVLLDGMKQEKMKYMKFLEHLSAVLNVESISIDVGFDFLIETIESKCRQLMKHETENVASSTSTVYTLQRKLKQLKEQLQSKDLHLDMLRKKLTDVQDENASKSCIQQSFETHVLETKRLKKKVVDLCNELEQERDLTLSLKARLCDTQETEKKTAENSQYIESLRSDNFKLRKNLKEIEEMMNDRIIENEERYSKLIKSSETHQEEYGILTDDLSTLRCQLRSIRERENQLLEFRDTIGKILGINISSSNVIDYDIIQRIEELIRLTQNNATAATVSFVQPAQVHQVTPVQIRSTSPIGIVTSSMTPPLAVQSQQIKMRPINKFQQQTYYREGKNTNVDNFRCSSSANMKSTRPKSPVISRTSKQGYSSDSNNTYRAKTTTNRRCHFQTNRKSETLNIDPKRY